MWKKGMSHRHGRIAEHCAMFFWEGAGVTSSALESAVACLFPWTCVYTPVTQMVPETGRKSWYKEDVPLVEEVKDWEYLSKILKSMGSDGMHPQLLKELADVITGPLLIILIDCGNWEKCLNTKGKRTSVFKKGKKE